MKKIVFVLSLVLVSCAGVKNNATSELDALQNQMAGFYTSEAQSKADKDYYNISLRMTPIWKDKGHYLFVEQALFDKQDKPYRVRVYKLSKNEKNQYVSEIFTIKNEKEWIGKWNTPKAYDALPLADIELKNGCEVVLEKLNKTTYKGQTGDKTCPSELRGAAFANSIVTVTDGKMVSWDQGFDKNGKQVWGAEKGGYEFVKINFNSN
jgi:CpeT protein